MSKLTGRERYVDDLLVESCWWGMTVRSPAPRGLIRAIRFGSGVDWSEFAIVDASDIPGANCIRHVEDDQPALARDAVRHVHEPVLLLAHPSRRMARRAVREVELVVDPEPPVLDYRIPPTPDQIQHGVDNTFAEVSIEKGNLEAAFASAAHRVEGVYETGAQEHVYLETQGMLAWVEGGVVTVQGSMQCPYFVHEALLHALDRSADQVRVIQAATGGLSGHQIPLRNRRRTAERGSRGLEMSEPDRLNTYIQSSRGERPSEGCRRLGRGVGSRDRDALRPRCT